MLSIDLERCREMTDMEHELLKT